MVSIQEILKKARQENCSDVHITQGSPIAIRKNGVLTATDMEPDMQETEKLILSLCSEKQIAELKQGKDQDFAYSLLDGTRHRVNVYGQMNGLAAAIRIINDKIPSLESLKLPDILRELAEQPRGLVLITGPTGSGKSTTLAAMVDHISKNRSDHILTVEDPIEYVFDQNRSLIHQREVGETVESFAAALRSAMREDPDIILVGEMRDYETISTAITAAETGHLVLSTLHTQGASQTIDRIIDTCPPGIQKQMRGQLSMVLRGIITQQLLPTTSGEGRIAATEILIGTDAVANLIREDKCYQLPSVMQSSKAMGMHTMNGNLAMLLKQGIITKETAVSASSDKKDLAYSI